MAEITSAEPGLRPGGAIFLFLRVTNSNVKQFIAKIGKCTITHDLAFKCCRG